MIPDNVKTKLEILIRRLKKVESVPNNNIGRTRAYEVYGSAQVQGWIEGWDILYKTETMRYSMLKTANRMWKDLVDDAR